MRTFMLSLFTLVGSVLAAEDFRAMAQVVQSTWSASPNLAVACNYASNREAVQRLADAFDGACHITVVDIRHPEQVGPAQSALIRLRPDLMVLLPTDPYVRDGSFTATLLIHGLFQAGIPSAGTSPVALKQGALFAVGEGTVGALLVNDHRVGIIGPVRGTSLRNGSKVSAADLGQPAPVRLISLK